jgi:HEAT repeat protein
MLGDAEWRVRKAASNALKRGHPTPLLLDHLIVAITDSDDAWKRMAAIDVMVSLGADDEGGDRVTASLLNALRSTNVDQRKFIVEVLGLMGANAAVGALVEELRSGDDNLQISVLDALAKIGDHRALQAVLERLRDGTAPVRFAALTTLQQLDDPSSEPAVIEALADTALRATAMDVLGQIGGRPAAVALWQWWTTGTAQERNHVLVALDRVVRRLPQLLRDDVIAQLRHCYQPNHQADLLEKLGASDIAVQRAAIGLAGWMREPEAVTPLVHALGGDLAGEAKQALSMMTSEHVHELLEVLPRSTPTIYCALIELLATTTEPSVLPVMKEALSATDSRVRRAAVLGIAAQGDRDSAPALVRLLLDHDPEVREAAVWALGRCRNETAVASVIALLDEESTPTRVTAARTLGVLQTAEGLEPLARALHDPEPAVRTAAVMALSQVGERLGETAHSKILADLNEHFLLALGDEAPSVRLEAARALQRREEMLPAQWWRCLADDPDQWVRGVAARSAASGGLVDAAGLHKFLRDESGAVRIAALEAVTEHPGAGDTETLRDAMRNEDPDVVSAALRALSAMAAGRPAGDAQANDRWRQCVNDAYLTLWHPVWTVRAAGMRALMVMDPEQARRRVEELAADDPHPRIRAEASRLLASTPQAGQAVTRPTHAERR